MSYKQILLINQGKDKILPGTILIVEPTIDHRQHASNTEQPFKKSSLHV